MESHKTVQSSAGVPGSTPLLLILAIIAAIAVGAGAFYLGLQKSAITEEQKALDAGIVSLEDEISILEGQKIQAAQVAQQWLDEVEAGELLWSHVITRIQSTLPVDLATQKPKIRILSYSGSNSGNLMINAQTVEAQVEPYEYVSELLNVFNNSSYFSEAIIPSITRGETDEGMKFLSFTLNFNYLPEAAPTTVGYVSSEAGTVVSGEDTVILKVPRITN